jgi:putative transposase
MLIDEAVESGARHLMACRELCLGRQTYYRWQSGQLTDRRKGAKKSIPRKLTHEERQRVVAACTNKEFRDLTPYEVYIHLLDADLHEQRVHDVPHFA